METLRRAVTATTLGIALAFALTACDRNLEPFDPEAEPARPDLSKIFPAPPEEDPVARELAGAQPTPAGGRGAPPVAAATGGGSAIRGRIELAGSAPAGATLFVIARPAGAAGGPPLAVVRVPEPRFPFDFEIGPDDVMIPGRPFAGTIELSARLDADGSASTRGADDLQGAAPAPVEPGSEGVRIVLGEG